MRDYKMSTLTVAGVVALAWLVVLVGLKEGWWAEAEYPAPVHTSSSSATR